MLRVDYGYFGSISDWVLARTSYKDEDDHIKFGRTSMEGTDTKEIAKAYFESLMKRGGRIIRLEDNQFEVGILLDGKVYESVDVWIDHRTAHGYSVYNFY